MKHAKLILVGLLCFVSCVQPKTGMDRGSDNATGNPTNAKDNSINGVLSDAVSKYPYYRTNPIQTENIEVYLRQSIAAYNDTLLDFSWLLGGPLTLDDFFKIGADNYGLVFSLSKSFSVPDVQNPEFASLENYTVKLAAQVNKDKAQNLSKHNSYDVQGKISGFANGSVPAVRLDEIDLGALVVEVDTIIELNK